MPNPFIYYVALADRPQKFPLLYASFIPVKRKRQLLNQAGTGRITNKTLFQTLVLQRTGQN